MRRLTLLAVLALGLAACGGSGQQAALKIAFGRNGGLIAPYTVTISPGGAVTATGSPPATPKSVAPAKDSLLSNQVRDGFGKLTSAACAGTFPDDAAYFITAQGKTVTIRGTCDHDFTTLFEALTAATGLTQ